MATAPSTDLFAIVGAVPGGANNTVEATVASGAPELLVAGGAGDNTKIIGNTINRQTYGMPQSALVVVSAYLNLAENETASYALEFQESANGSSWDTAVAVQAATVVKTATGGAFTDNHVETYKVNLAGRKQYIRFNLTPDLSASNTDTGTFHYVVLLGGAHDNSLLPSHQTSYES